MLTQERPDQLLRRLVRAEEDEPSDADPHDAGLDAAPERHGAFRLERPVQDVPDARVWTPVPVDAELRLLLLHS